MDIVGHYRIETMTFHFVVDIVRHYRIQTIFRV